MLSKEELKLRKITFWNDLKVYMNNFRSSNGKRINWLSYPTEIKDVFLRLNTEKNTISINLDFQFRDKSVRSVFWEQMGELKTVLTSQMTEPGDWIENCSSDTVSDFCRIQWKKDKLNYLNTSDKEQIFLYFKEKLIGFDLFYQEYKDILIFLAK